MGTTKGTAPTRATIRAYNVGFGDCFLVTFHYRTTARHVLIDFGSTAAAKKGVSLDTAIAEDIYDVTKGHLTAVVATHRHADHISGFETRNGKGSGDMIRACAKDAVIVQPWTEDPVLRPDATTRGARTGRQGLAPARAQVRSMEAMHAVAGMIERRAAAINLDGLDASSEVEAPAPEAVGEIGREGRPEAGRALGISARTREHLRFLGETNLKNVSAVRNLATMSSPARRHYVSFGSSSGLAAVLPGVKAEVLGPPTVDQSAKVLKERRDDQAEFWMLAAAATRLTTAKSRPLFPGERVTPGDEAPRYARWLVRRMRTIHAQQLVELVRIVDDALNNTSVILLFTIRKTRLLFPGDAQVENWEYALRSEAIREKLASVNVYKVGHHGSRNATPKTLWRGFRNRRKGLKSVLSTKAGKFPGRSGSGTEVPRDTLMKALEQETVLTNTQTLAGTKNSFFADVEVSLR